MWLDWPELEDGSVVPLRSKYRHVPILAASDWCQPMQWKVVEFGDMTDAQLAVAIINLRLEQPYGSTLMKLDALRRKLAEVGLTAEEWNINFTHAGRLPDSCPWVLHGPRQRRDSC